MKRLKTLEMTCGACPSQWDGETENGAYVYIRYRYGLLRVDMDQQTVFEATVGDSLGGVMGTDEMLRITGLEMVSENPTSET